MGELLGIGLSHYPPIRGTDDAMAGILRGTLVRPDLPPEVKDPKNWPEAMRAEWGDDEGRSFAPKHRDAFVKHLRAIREQLDRFNPDFIVMWGDDQYENFKEDIVPSFCVYAYDDLDIYPYRPHGARGPQRDDPTALPTTAAPPNVWGDSADTKVTVRGKRDAAKYLTRGLIRERFDVAYAYEPLHYDGLSHAFLNGAMYLDYDRKGFEYPIIPIAVNCYGSRVLVNRGGRYPIGHFSNPEGDLDPPGPSPQRCMELGAAAARVLKASPWRVALVASSSWSHAFLTPKHHFLYPDVDADRELYAAMTRGDFAYWHGVTEEEVVDRGQQEVLNWWCLLGAMEELGHSAPDYHGYVESYVMNSNKAFAVYNPR